MIPQPALDGAQYSGSIAWTKGDDSSFTGAFAASTVYKAALTLTAKSGYTFTGVTANSFTHTGASSITNAANSGTITITFNATTSAVTVVHQYDLNALVTAPVTGGTPQTTITAAQYTGTIEWKIGDTPFGGAAFDVYTEYKAVLTLTATNGYTFNGIPANIFTHADAASVTNAASSGTVIITFKAAGLTWYVSSSGNDTNSGLTADAPLATVTEALAKIATAYTGSWPGKGTKPETATIIISGSIAADTGTSGATGGMVKIIGADIYPPIELRGPATGSGAINAAGKGRRVLYIAGGQNVTLGANLTLKGGTVTGFGGGVYVEDSTFIMNGGEISDNTVTVSGTGGGGGVHVTGTSNFILDGGVILNNNAGGTGATSCGGGVYINGTGTTFTMYDGEISDNMSWGNPLGGGVHVENGEFVLRGGKIMGNYIESATIVRGGGVSCSATGSFKMIGGSILNNTAKITDSYASHTGYGAGVYVDGTSGLFEMTGGEISGNIGPGGYAFYGGGVYTIRNFKMSGGKISANTITSACSNAGSIVGGGGVYASHSFEMIGGIISGNTITALNAFSSSNYAYGGGVYVAGPFTKAVTPDCIIYGNDASVGLKNIAQCGGTPLGHAVYANGKLRTTTAGADVALDSTIAGSAGGWGL